MKKAAFMYTFKNGKIAVKNSYRKNRIAVK